MIGAILQFLYFLVGFGCVCVGVFGMSATKTDRLKKAEELAPTRAFFHHTSQAQRTHETYQKLTQQQLWWTLICATVWPLGIPLYLAWKKGTFVDEAMKKREEMLHGPDSAG